MEENHLKQQDSHRQPASILSKKSRKPINKLSLLKNLKTKQTNKGKKYDSDADLETLMTYLCINQCSHNVSKLKTQKVESESANTSFDYQSKSNQANDEFELRIAKMSLDYDKLRSEITQNSLAHAELMLKLGSYKIVFTFSREDGTGLVDSALYCNLDDRNRFLRFWEEKVGKAYNTSTVIQDHFVSLKEHRSVAKKVVENFSTYSKYLSKLQRVLGSRIRTCANMHNTFMLLHQTGPPFEYLFYQISKKCIDENLSISSNVDYAKCPRLVLMYPSTNEPSFLVGDLLEFVERSNLFPVNCVYPTDTDIRRNEIMDEYNERYVLNDGGEKFLGFIIACKNSTDGNTRKYKINDSGNDELITKHISYSWFESDNIDKIHLLPGNNLNSYF